ncbi:hypothetical protein BAU15_15040 [Enterococcus sp. JM4C]|uniref:beta-galactosidase n=1 Tax=Candidatus Enterococcus huntleyi TaxID=1857217 RepID=UPI00137A4A3F|nr:beta-galactosidase [Enterococcus sp. JM4C]KAF1296290.1 hypothetical protein BAU15_15040 [Enterococcus sp. JM4C]
MESKMIGTNYHPHDWSPEQWEADLDLMKEAGFSVVRVGHLCWDSFEPSEGKYEFEWMDTFLEECRKRNISVFMDVPTRPAPIWLHKKFPSIDIVNKEGIRLNPNTRYMEDVGDPNFQTHALKFAATLSGRYAEHPAIMGFGLCNELGSGFHSYSSTALNRYQQWLEKKYKTIDSLNKNWNGKRWSRKFEDFSDIFFPVSGDTIVGSPENSIDCERFFSDEILNYFHLLSVYVREQAPNVAISTNHWAENKNAGFDYQKNYQEVIDYPGIGFYPGINPEYVDGVIGACMNSDHRIGELDKPIWALEFQTGTNGGYAAPAGALRMYAYLSWVYRNDMVCAWTFRTMLGGEEQYFFGLLDHDGHPSPKFFEMKQLATEWQQMKDSKIERKDNNQRIGVAYSFDSSKVMQYATNYYKKKYKNEEVLNSYKALFNNNLDCNLIDLRRVTKEYSVVIVPGQCVMDQESANTIRRMVEQGTTVIMTAYSAKVNEHNQAFDTPLPGYLSDVFGIKVRGFDRTITHVSTINEGGIEKSSDNKKLRDVDIVMNGEKQNLAIDYYEFIETDTAETIASYSGSENDLTTAVSRNNYGKGQAIYVGIPSDEQLIASILASLNIDSLVTKQPDKGIVTRKLNNNAQIFINTNNSACTVALEAEGTDLFNQQKYKGTILLKPYDVKIIEY